MTSLWLELVPGFLSFDWSLCLFVLVNLWKHSDKIILCSADCVVLLKKYKSNVYRCL